MQKWEYQELVVELDIKLEWFWRDTHESLRVVKTEKRLTQMGREGWKLVSAYTQNGSTYTNAFYYIFKRPLP